MNYFLYEMLHVSLMVITKWKSKGDLLAVGGAGGGRERTEHTTLENHQFTKKQKEKETMEMQDN